LKFVESNCEICVTLFANPTFFDYNGNVNIKNRPPLNAELINSKLTNGYIVYPIFETITSTNSYVKEHIDELNHGSIILAKHQSLGRGRFDRTFESNTDRGIYCTFLLKENLDYVLNLINLKIACALHFSIKECFDIDTQIKWPNDLIIGQKKCAGILIETHYLMSSTSLNAIIIGWGLNVYNQVFNESLKHFATTLEEQSTNELDRNKLIIHFFNHIDNFLTKIDIIDYYKQHMIPVGNTVKITINDHKELVQIIDINKNGQLIVKLENNAVITLFNEEISTLL